MKKVLRIGGIIIVLLLALIIILPYFFQDRIAEEIKKAINEQLNAQVEFSDVSLSLLKNFPELTLEIESFRIINNAPFEGTELTNIAKISTTMDLMSVLGDEIRVNNIALDNPIVNVQVLSDGSANYDIAKESEDTAETTEEESEGSFKLQLDGYSISNGKVLFNDQSLPMVLILDELDHNGSGDFTAEEFTLDTKTTVKSLNVEYDGVEYLHKVNTVLDAKLEMNLAQMIFTISDNLIQLNDLQMSAEGFVKMPADDIEMDIKFSALRNEFKQLLSMVPAEFASDLSGVDASGSMSVSGFVKGIYNDRSMPGFGLDVEVKDGRFKYPDLPSSAENIQVQASIDASDGNNFDAMTLAVPQFHMELANNPVDMRLALSHPVSDPDIDFSLQSQLDLEKLSDVVPLEGQDIRGKVTADFALKGRLSSIEKQQYDKFNAEGQLILQQFLYTADSLAYDLDIDVAYFNFSPQYLNLSQFKASVGESDFSMSGKVEDYIAFYLKDETVRGNFNFSANKINLNEFMSEETEEETASTDSTTSTGVFRVPKNINFNLNAAIDQLIYDNLEIDDVKGSVVLNEGIASLENLNLNMMEGSVTVNGDYDSNPEQPTLNFNYDVRNFDIKQTAEAFNTVDKLAPIAKKCQGKFSTKMKFSTVLDQNMEPIEESMVGNGTLQTQSVYIAGFEPMMKVADALGIDKLSKQTIEDVALSYKIKDGKAIVDPFKVKMEGMEATIHGNTTFEGDIDYYMDMDVPFSKLPSSVGNQANKLTGLINDKFGSNVSAGTTIPVKLHITGTIEKPNVGTDLKDNASNAAKETIDDLKEQAKEEVKEIIEDTKEDALKQAREEADKILADAQKEADRIVEEARVQAEKVRSEGYKNASDLENKGANFAEKLLNKEAAKKLRQEADKSADKIISEAQKQADKVMATAQKQADAKLESVE